MTPSEQYVFDLCQKSFLPFWSFPNPLGKKGKELCDAFIICGNDIVIISVKEICVSEHPDEMIQYERWQRKAITDSVGQIYGAERYLKTVNEILIKDRETIITLPPLEKRTVYKIAVALGGKKEFPLETGDFGNGFVHVFDEESTFTVFNELDTITDFISYLKAKEHFLKKKRILVPKEVDFLALYLQTSLLFDVDPDLLVIDDDMWSEYIKSKEYIIWKREIQDSYIWDRLVEQLYQTHIAVQSNQDKRKELEVATRIIALEPRTNRIELGVMLRDAIERQLKARMLKALPNSDHSYVFMPLNQKNWANKEKELQLRCLVARSENNNAPKVIGLGIGISPNNEYMFDLVYFDIHKLSDEILGRIKLAKAELGYFQNPTITHSRDLR